jgi:hypothetical protein
MRSRLLPNILALALPALTLAQQPEPEFEIPPDLGFFRIVNATGREGKLWARVNGVRLAAETGYEDGFATGPMAILEKGLSVELKHDTLGELEMAVTLEAGTVTTLIAHTVVRRPDDGEGGESVKLAGYLLKLPASKRGEPSTLSLIQFTPATQLAVSIQEKESVLEPAKEVTLPLSSDWGAFLDVKVAGQTVAQLNFTDPAGQGVVLYTDAQGRLLSSTFRNDAQ